MMRDMKLNLSIVNGYEGKVLALGLERIIRTDVIDCEMVVAFKAANATTLVTEMAINATLIEIQETTAYLFYQWGILKIGRLCCG